MPASPMLKPCRSRKRSEPAVARCSEIRTAMRFGRITNCGFAISLLLFAAVALPGCGRNQGAKSADGEPKLQSAPAKETASTNQSAAKAAQMVLIPGGKFVMGDKDEVDAPPHKVT